MTLDAALTLAQSVQDDPVLPQAVREHLGLQLRALYDPLGALSASKPIQELLERLDVALAAYGEALTAEVRAGMTAQMPSLMRFALSLTKDHARAEDLVQEALMKAWRSRHTYDVGTNVAAWLTIILRNAFYTHHRKRALEVEDPDEEYTLKLSTPPVQEDGLHLQDMQAALAQLSADQRETLILVVLNDLSYEEAALAMGCKVGTVKSRVWRARERLARILGSEGPR